MQHFRRSWELSMGMKTRCERCQPGGVGRLGWGVRGERKYWRRSDNIVKHIKKISGSEDKAGRRSMIPQNILNISKQFMK